jgi:hypothetical protein
MSEAISGKALHIAHAGYNTAEHVDEERRRTPLHA